MTRPSMPLFTLIAVLLAGCVGPGARLHRLGATPGPSVVMKAGYPEPPGNVNVRVIYYDDAFLWMARDFGTETVRNVPGLFVHSKAHGGWRQIEQIATKDGTFGSSHSENLEESRKLMGSSVSWDFTKLAAQPWVDIPLKTGWGIVFPDKVEFDAATDRYKLSFLSAWEIKSAVTVLWVNRRDLAGAFEMKKP